MIRRDFCKTSLALAGLALRSERYSDVRSQPVSGILETGLTKRLISFATQRQSSERERCLAEITSDHWRLPPPNSVGS